MRGKLLAAVGALLLIVTSAAASDDLVVRESRHSVPDTIDRLVAVLKDKGIAPAARIDHAAAAKANGLDLRPSQVLLFGNPKLGTPLMQANPRIGLDLPMRVIAWQDEAGKTMIAYTAPVALAKRYGGVGETHEALKAMTGALDAFTKAAAE